MALSTTLLMGVRSSLRSVVLRRGCYSTSAPWAATYRSSGRVHAMADTGIAVIGGGLGGLTFARVMQTKGLDVTIFEREPSRESRGQGGVLDLHPESGQWALIQAGLEAEYRSMARAEGQDMRIMDKHGNLLWDEVSPADLMERPEVDRPALRNLLIESLRPETIRWDHHVISIEPSGDDGPYEIRFANGATTRAAVVIGADGARSRVRPLVNDAEPTYAGVSFVEIGIPDAERLHIEAAKTVGRGSLFALGDNKGMIAQRNGDGRIRIYVAFRMQEGGFSELGIAFNESHDLIRKAIMNQFEGWAPEIIDLIRACDNSFVPRPLYALPVGISWPSMKTVTLLGDAAHLMSPFAGAGANLAMQDGAALALKLFDSTDSASAILAFEREMFERAEQEARQSEECLGMCISQDGATRFAQQMSYYQSGQ
ncbi:zeaxanthin epoxidase [Klebsormidium nitens]|uniref:Zeaxanthin epoxidase n=1 Tax=Klebsormidium nitens TaxID=105231 RepID=A0A1Y1HTL4_KLENI|nr:zeaxanthin epoxidase [Klebsormidium nitens]|eukprot:GAQ81182.1 zeaxanthin epoxidase [Klebsormidium nitens]